MRGTGAIAWLVTLILAFVPSIGLAATYTLAPSADGYLKQSSPTENNGTTSEMIVNEKAASTDSFRTIYAFNLSAIPAGETIVSATLRLYVRQSSATPVNVHRITGAWTESTVNWSNTGTLFQATAAASFTPSTTDTFVTVSITALAQSWKTTPSANYGLMLISSAQAGESKYTSREWSTVNQRPQLVIVTTATPGTLSASVASTAISDPVSGTTNPKFIPAVIANYSITVSNISSGTVDADTTIITSPIPSTMRLFVGNLGGAGSGPVQFVQGSPSSGLSYSFVSLASGTDSVSFSNNGGASYAYVPTADANGYDASVTHIRIAPSGTMTGLSSFQLIFRTQLD